MHHEGHLRLSISHHAMSQTLVKKAHLAWRLSGKVDDDDDGGDNDNDDHAIMIMNSLGTASARHS